MKARLIKARSGATTAERRCNLEMSRLVTRREQEAESRARAIVQHAEDEARHIYERAQSEAAKSAGELRARAEADAAAFLLESTKRVQERAEALLHGLEGDLTRLGVMIAEKLLGQQLELEPSRIVDIVAQVLQSAGSCRRAVLRVNPQDVPYVDAQVARLGRDAGIQRLIVTGDPTIARGGCVLESPLGEVDGRLHAQLATIAGHISQGGE